MSRHSRRDTTPPSEEQLLERHEIFTGKILRLVVDRVGFPDGSIASRELVFHPGAAAILPTLPDGRILLVSQYRHPALASLWEIPAGKLKPGEDTLACAKRELLEETGYAAAKWEEVMSFYSSPGFTDERITLFRACVLNKVSEPRLGEIESLRVIGLDETRRLVADGTICDAKTILAILTLQLPGR